MPAGTPSLISGHWRDTRARSQECCHHRERCNVRVPLHPADGKRQVAVVIIRAAAINRHAQERDEKSATDHDRESAGKVEALNCHCARGPDEPERNCSETDVGRDLPDNVESRVSCLQWVGGMRLVEIRPHGEKSQTLAAPAPQAACPWSFSPLTTSWVAYPLANLHLVHRRQDGIKPLLQFSAPGRSGMREHIELVLADCSKHLCSDIGRVDSGLNAFGDLDS